MTEVSRLVILSSSPDVELSAKREAFEQLVRRFQDMAYACAYARLLDRALAEDAAQDAFITAWLNLDSLRAPEAFAGWLRQILLRHCTHLAAKKRIVTVPLEDALQVPSEIVGPAEVFEQKELRHSIDELIGALPEHERMTVLLYYMGERSQSEVAVFLGVSTNVIKQRLHKARLRLKKGLDAMTTEFNDFRPSRSEEFSNRVRLRLRAFDGDYEKLSALTETFSNSQSHHLYRKEDREEWLANRRGFADAGLIPRSYIVENGVSKEELAYGCIERVDLPVKGDYPFTGRPGTSLYRVHLVLSPAAIDGGAGQLLYERLEADALALGATGLWVRDIDDQIAVLDLLAQQGFHESYRVQEWNIAVEESESSVPVLSDGLTITTLAEERLTNPEYVHHLHAFWNAPGTSPASSEAYSLDQIEQRLLAPDVVSESYFIAKRDNRIVGTLIVRRPLQYTPRRPYFAFRVLAEEGHLEVGRRLIEAATVYGRNHGYSVLTTYFREKDAPDDIHGLALYKSIEMVVLEKTLANAD